MRPNKVKWTLRQSGVAIGTLVFEFNTPGIGRIVADSDIRGCSDRFRAILIC